jgi:hypothetical protein
MPLSVRYLHLSGHPQTLHAGSQSIAHSDDAVGLLRGPVRAICPLSDTGADLFLHAGCVTVADTVYRKSFEIRLFPWIASERIVYP